YVHEQLISNGILQFLHWASLFPDGLFVHIVAYVDESSTHAGSRETTVGGIVGTKEVFSILGGKWQNVLRKYDATHFHFRLWSDASCVVRGMRSPSSDFSKNPYRTWD